MVANPISADFALVNPIAAPEMAGSFLALDGAGAKVLNGHLTAQEKASLRGSSGRGGGSWRVAGAYEAEEDRGEEEEGTHDEPVARLEQQQQQQHAPQARHHHHAAQVLFF